jgi:Concanavalin A-like lectin/glucanases superfamily/Immunoglobulin I-set domain
MIDIATNPINETLMKISKIIAATRCRPRWLSTLPSRMTCALLLVSSVALLLTTAAQAQVVLTDIGASAPTPGANDISQLTVPSGANNPDGLNYYFDNGNPPGQTFTTGTNPNGYVLTSLAIKTAGNGNLPAAGQAYVLYIYSVSGSAATLVATYTSQAGFTFTETDWLQWTGLGATLEPNAQYAYSLHRVTTGWENLANITGNLYAGGEVVLIPTAGGTMTLGSSHSFDATFDIGLTLPAAPIPNQPIESPAFGSGGIVAGTSVTLTATAAGSTPIGFQWQTDGGSGGALTNIPGAIGTNLVVNTTGFALGAYQYDFVATNSLGTNTSPAATITIAPVAMMDIGTNAPTPGPVDISQLLNTTQNDDGFNYYTDDGAGHANWTGQTFATGTNSNGYLLQTLAWKSAGNGNSFGNWQLYDLYFYSISTDGNTATLIASYQGYGGGVENDWFQWQGLSVGLAPNQVYAYTFGRDATAGGWEHIGNQGGNPYAGGQLITIANANTNGGPITYGTTGNSDTTFDLGLVVSQKPFASPPTYTPFVNPIYAATPVTLQETGVGTPPLTYQWLTDNGTGGALVSVGGATGSSLVVNTTAGTYNYAVIVKNTFGSSTSAPVILNISAASAPVLVTDITPVSNPVGTNQGYVGQTLTYSAAFTGTLPITYQWYFNGSPIPVLSNPSAVSNTLVLANLQPGNAGTYYVLANNSKGSLPSGTSGLAVLTPPAAPASGTYGAMVLSTNPTAFWRLNEANDPSTGVLPAYDASGHNFDGVYGQYTENGFDGIQGPQSPAFPGFEANNTALFTQIGNPNSYVSVPPLNLNTNAVTITMWINPNGAVAASSGLLFNRSSTDAAGLGFGNTVNASGVAELGYTWNTNSAATYNFHSGLYPVVGVWSFVALVVQTNQATIYLYYIDPNTGNPDLYSAVNPIAHGLETFGGGTNTIGTDAYNLVSRVFNGDIDDVAVFKSAFTSDQILAQFSKAAGLGPVAASISGQPQSVGAYAGKTVNLTATGINGSSPITYQWQLGGVNLTDGGNIFGSQTPSLTISNAATTNSGTYKLLVTNPVGTTPSSNAIVTVVSPVPGSYEAAVLANNPFAFWKLNETSDPSVGGVAASDYVGGHAGIYQPAAQNGFNGIVGPEAPAFPGFPAINTALETFNGTAASFVTASAGTLLATNLTYAMWINPSAANGAANGLLFDRGGAGEGININNNSVNGAGQGALGYTWNQNNANTWNWNSGIFPTPNKWQFVALVITPTSGTVYLIDNNGVQSATNAIPHDAEEFGVAWHIGDDAFSGTGGRTFPGSIADVSVYLSALSSSQLTSLYDAGLGIFPPPVTLHIAQSGTGSVTLTWSQGTLLQSTNVAGPWTPNAAASPYTVGTTNSKTFFRVLVQ